MAPDVAGSIPVSHPRIKGLTGSTCRYTCRSSLWQSKPDYFFVCISHVSGRCIAVDVIVVRMSACRINFCCTPTGVPTESNQVR